MDLKKFRSPNQANESISKYKLLSAYGGPGSIVHTQYGSIIISCIEEWGFLKRIIELNNNAIQDGKNEPDRYNYVKQEAQRGENGNIIISNDQRLLKELKSSRRLNTPALQYLVLIPDIEIKDFDNKIKAGEEFAIPSSFMPKIFSDGPIGHIADYNTWYEKWGGENDDKYGNKFFPPKNPKGYPLNQDNIVLICRNGHISDFPWSRFLRWRTDSPRDIYLDEPVDLFNHQACCGSSNSSSAKLRITSNASNSSGFAGKYLKCDNCSRSVSLEGIMNVKIKCPGHKPWEANTSGNHKYPYSGNNGSRRQGPPYEPCLSTGAMRVALTTGNNLYFSKAISSIYMPQELFLNDIQIAIEELKTKKTMALKNEEYKVLLDLQAKIKELERNLPTEDEGIDEQEMNILFRNQEFKALLEKDEEFINSKSDELRVKDVTLNLDPVLRTYFNKILRIDDMKITTAQLGFTRVFPDDSDTSEVDLKRIFKSDSNEVIAYPVIENFGEGIFFSFDPSMIEKLGTNSKVDLIEKINELGSDSFSKSAINYAKENGWQLYLAHTFSHILIRELEFRCGYPSASLSERLYISNEEGTLMYGVLIYTAEGAEGSMGGLIAQTSVGNLNNLIKSALMRATICNSDPLCWESKGQGLFNLNFASCFSCGLISETSCEHRNLYLDRRILIDPDWGLFKKIINEFS